METYLVDTSLLIDHLRGKPQILDFLLQNRPSVSIVTLAELIQGTKNKNQMRAVEDLLTDLPLIQINQSISLKAITLMKKYFHSNHFEYLDALIAGTAIEENLSLITANIKHFQMLKELKLLSWPII